MKKRDMRNEQMAKLCETINGKDSEGARRCREANRRLEKRRRASMRKGSTE